MAEKSRPEGIQAAGDQATDGRAFTADGLAAGAVAPAPARAGRRRAGLAPYAALAFLALTWGASFLFIKVAVRDVSPPALVLGRCASAAVVLLVLLAARRRSPLARGGRRLLPHFAVMAVIYSLIPWTGIAFGEQTVSSGLASILNATSPLWTALFAWWVTPDERPGAVNYAGVALGFAGTVLLVAPGLIEHGFNATALGVGAILVAAAAYAAGSLYQRRHLRAADSLHAGFWQMALAAGIALPLALPAGGPRQLPLEAVLSILALGALSSGLGVVVYFYLLNTLGAARASTVIFLLPVTALFWGALLLHEAVTLLIVAGMAVVLAGVALATRPRAAPR